MQNHCINYPFRVIPIDNSQDTPPPGRTWTSREVIKHAAFARHFSAQLPSGRKNRIKQWDFYRHLSLFVQSKTPNQCRIFHQKVLKQFRSLDKFLGQIHRRIRSFEEWYNLYEPRLRVMEYNLQRERNPRPVQVQMQVPARKQLEEMKTKEEFKTDVTYPDEPPSMQCCVSAEEKGLPVLILRGKPDIDQQNP